jgi:carbamoylphosphate synthase small subunit
MYQKNQICEKIKSIYPDVGNCGIDIQVDFDSSNKAWAVVLKKNHQELKTFLEPEDADVCMENRQCIGLGWQIYQLRDNIKLLAHSHS